jgi:Second Messenger Oligonucleotide or Dinucleotide Synthetase domain
MAQRFLSRDDIKDLLLTEVAVAIQLPPSLYRLATERIETLSAWLERPESELAGRVSLIYPQGSMAINATIASCLDRDEFDIDIIVQLLASGFANAKQVLDALYRAIKGSPGSRYYQVTRRNTRCVTVQYGEMHVDLTPAELIPQRVPRVSSIFHHKPESNDLAGIRVTANPFGFAEWFNGITAHYKTFEDAFSARSIAMDALFAKAETEETPEQLTAYQKAPAVVALQLLKRFRNVCYEYRKGRRPPGVLLAAIVAESSSRTGTLFDELLFQARKLLQRLAHAQQAYSLLSVANPTCPEDRFTDRWPATLEEQQIFLGDLNDFVLDLERIQFNADLESIQRTFSKLFGARIARTVMDSFNDRSGEQIALGSLMTDLGTGRANFSLSRTVHSAAAAAAIPTVARAAPRHTFFGSE